MNKKFVYQVGNNKKVKLCNVASCWIYIGIFATTFISVIFSLYSTETALESFPNL